MSREEWKKLRAGNYIVSKRGTIRKVIDYYYGYIRLDRIRGNGTKLVCYADCDKYMFNPLTNLK